MKKPKDAAKGIITGLLIAITVYAIAGSLADFISKGLSDILLAPLLFMLLFFVGIVIALSFLRGITKGPQEKMKKEYVKYTFDLDKVMKKSHDKNSSGLIFMFATVTIGVLVISFWLMFTFRGV